MYFTSIEKDIFSINLKDYSSVINELNDDNEFVPLPFYSKDIYNLINYLGSGTINSSLNNEEVFQLCIIADYLDIKQLIKASKIEIVKILNKNSEELLKDFPLVIRDLEEFTAAHFWYY